MISIQLDQDLIKTVAAGRMHSASHVNQLGVYYVDITLYSVVQKVRPVHIFAFIFATP